MHRTLPFLLLIPLFAQAAGNAAVTLALIHATRSDLEVNNNYFSPTTLLTTREEKTSEASLLKTGTSPIRYPHFLSPMNIPLRVTSAFSLRWHPIMHRFSRHEGTDYAAPLLTPVFATEKGIVLEAMYHPTAGNYVVVSHPQGWRSRYLHLTRLNVIAGQKIARGDILAYSGNTGRSTGPHLHFELIYQGQAMDAAKLLSSSDVSYWQAADVSVSTISVPRIMLVTEIAGQEKVMVRYNGKTVYASADQRVFGDYKVILKNGRYRLQKMS